MSAGPLLSTLTILVAVAAAGAAEPRELVDQGNRLFRAGKYAEAEKKYNEAAVDLVDSHHVAFNKGAVYYKRGDYQKAIEQFSTALATHDRRLETKTLYNLGNAFFQEAVKLQQDLPKAIERLRAAATHYRDCLEAEPGHAGARHNLDLAKRFLKRLIDEKRKQDEKKKQQQKSPQSQPQSQPQTQPQQKQQQQQQPGQQKQKIGREEAERRLRRALAEQMEKRRQRLDPKQRGASRLAPVDRDW